MSFLGRHCLVHEDDREGALGAVEEEEMCISYQTMDGSGGGEKVGMKQERLAWTEHLNGTGPTVKWD